MRITVADLVASGSFGFAIVACIDAGLTPNGIAGATITLEPADLCVELAGRVAPRGVVQCWP